MNLQGDGIGDWVREVAKQANKLVIVSPFFSVNTDMTNLIKGISDLQIFVGDEFSTNNPWKIKELSEVASADVRCIYKENLDGRRLHAKVFYAEETSGRCQALVGSANFTVSGLTSNKEQAVSFDSNDEADSLIIDQIKQWIDKLENSARYIDWEQAEKQYESSRRNFERRPDKEFENEVEESPVYHLIKPEAQRHWVLKTRAGSLGPSQWEYFVKEKVISVGWEGVVRDLSEEGIKASEYSLDVLEASCKKHLGSNNRSLKHAAKSIYWFSREFSKQDRVIICDGYPASQKKDVHLYGLAIIKDYAYDHSESSWWRLKHSAEIKVIDMDIPKEVFTSTLKNQSMLHTIHEISKDNYERFLYRIREF